MPDFVIIDKKRFGLRIQAARKLRNESVIDVAKSLQINAATLRAIERGESSPQKRVMEALTNWAPEIRESVIL
jgi:transcriptional regulator with XRE-family HTH domain